MDGLIQKIINDNVNNINAQKEVVINQVLKENNIDFDIELESKKRFKNIVSEISGGTETYYYNDGSINGLKLVTFVFEEISYDGMSGFNFSYYWF